MADKQYYWMEVNVSCGPLNSDGSRGPSMASSPHSWAGLSYDDLLALQGILHDAQGKLLALSHEKAKTKK